jgi:hypothetical protein
MYDYCIFDRDEQCLHNCPKCPEFRKKCFKCGEEFESGETRYSFHFEKRGVQEICSNCLFEIVKGEHYKDFADEHETEYRRFIEKLYYD